MLVYYLRFLNGGIYNLFLILAVVNSDSSIFAHYLSLISSDSAIFISYLTVLLLFII